MKRLSPRALEIASMAVDVLSRDPIHDPLIFMHRQKAPKLPTTWRKAMSSHLARPSELFSPCVVEYGDRKTRGVQIVCGKCGRIGKTPMNSVAYTTGGWDSTEKSDRLASHKFGTLNWIVGRVASRHRCPECVAATKPLAAAVGALKPLMITPTPKKEEPTMPNGREPMPMAASVKVVDVAEDDAVREMTRDDRRVIFAKLQDVYDNERTGYTLDWTDKRVSEDLGVPRAWVAKVRDENFGPDHNSEFIEQIAFAKAVISDVRVLERDLVSLQAKHAQEIAAFAARLKPMLTVMDKTERTIAGIEKMMR